MRYLAVFILIFISCNVLADDYKPMDKYSSIPLEDPVFDYAKVVVDVTTFNNWLNTNYSKLDAKSMKGPREHLYYLLSSYVSAIYKRDGVILPKNPDLIIEILLSWSEKLGVYGSHLFYNKIKNPKSEAKPPFTRVPEKFTISAVNDMFVVKTKNNSWEIRFPYYFMIDIVTEFTANNGMPTQIFSIATGAAKDNTKTGRSQSTLMFVHTPINDIETFKKFWLNQFGIEGAVNDDVSSDPKKYYIYEKQEKLHKELKFIHSQEGVFLVAYMGMDGAYQTNRPHFLDFISQINIPSINDNKTNN